MNVFKNIKLFFQFTEGAKENSQRIWSIRILRKQPVGFQQRRSQSNSSTIESSWKRNLQSRRWRDELSRLLRRLHPLCKVVLVERNRRYDSSSKTTHESVRISEPVSKIEIKHIIYIISACGVWIKWSRYSSGAS